jgi:ADP-ribosylglycohydrolase
MTPLSETALRDKVLGCWMGKNCGGTLGGPLEKVFSEEKPLDVWYYPEVREGGIPNDDLEIQLIWLRALEEIGLDLTADDLAEYWLDHVAYNFDEYGLMKTNLRLGLRPPVAGFYNNYFKDCMGCPIRTEVWACIAPGRPRIAARYALIDSVVDHAGGESLYGSLFNVTVEAAAFVVKDPSRLVEIGLSYLPAQSLTARCIQAAMRSHRAGDDWLEARRKVLEVGRHPIAQYSPPNIAFQVVGWLYGADFGDAICKAVNCGYDTDCTAATLGAILGIIDGAGALPEKWTKPLGDAIATSDPNGVKNLYLQPHPAPRTLGNLTDRILQLERQVTARFGPALGEDSMFADPETLRLIAEPPTRISTRLGPRLHLDLDYGTTPQIGGGATANIDVTIRHDFPEETATDLQVEAPDGWNVEPAHTSLTLTPGTPWSGRVKVRAPERAALENTESILFRVCPRERPVPITVPLVFIGAPIWLRSGPFSWDGKSAGELLDQELPPEVLHGSWKTEAARKGDWKIVEADGNDVGPCVGPFDRGVVYLRGFLHSTTARPICLHVGSTVPAQVWLNGEIILQSKTSRPLRPNHSGNPVDQILGDFQLLAGWNELLLKFATDATTPPFACHVLYSDRYRLHAGLVDVGWTRFPWDEA